MTAVRYPLPPTLGGLGADLSALTAGHLIKMNDAQTAFEDVGGALDIANPTHADSATALFSATVTNAADATSSVTMGAEAAEGVDSSLALRAGAGGIRISPSGLVEMLSSDVPLFSSQDGTIGIPAFYAGIGVVKDANARLELSDSSETNRSVIRNGVGVMNFEINGGDPVTLDSSGNLALPATALGKFASSAIGSGDNGTVNLVAGSPGLAGNAFTVEVAAGVGNDQPMTAAFTGPALLVTLGTDSGGSPDATKNTATLIAGAINTAAGGVTATASGTGADAISAAEGPHTFAGGQEAVTVAGGFAFAGAGLYLTNLPATDPGIPGALYHTAGAVMVSL